MDSHPRLSMGGGRLMIAPVGTPPDSSQWEDLGVTDQTSLNLWAVEEDESLESYIGQPDHIRMTFVLTRAERRALALFFGPLRSTKSMREAYRLRQLARRRRGRRA